MVFSSKIDGSEIAHIRRSAHTLSAVCHLRFPLAAMVVHKSCDMADLDFQGKHADEEMVFYFHQHWIRLLWPFVKMILWNVFVFGAGYATFVIANTEDILTRRLMLNIFTIFFTLTHFGFLVSLYKYLLYVIVITDKKIHRIKKTLLSINDHQSIDLWMLQDINKCQHSIIQNIFGFGSIILEAQETVLRLHFIPHVEKNCERFMDIRERVRNTMMYYGGRVSPGKSKTSPRIFANR